MSNVESYQKTAKERMLNKELNDFELSFVEKIWDYNKKQLQGMSYQQYSFLRKIASTKL